MNGSQFIDSTNTSNGPLVLEVVLSGLLGLARSIGNSCT